MKLRFKSALVTGATGFIGSALVRSLVSGGIEVFCLNRPQKSPESREKQYPGVHCIEADFASVPDLRNKLKGISAEIVFNLAAYGVQQKQSDIELTIKGNVDILSNLLMAISDWPLRSFIHMGSCFEYMFASNDKLINEDHPIQPQLVYGAAKAAAVLCGNAIARQFQLPFLTLRLFGVYGPGERANRLIPYIVEQLKNDQGVDLTLGEQQIDYLFIEDMVQAIKMAALMKDPKYYSVYNVCSGIPVTVRKIAETAADILKKPKNLLLWGKRPYRINEPMFLVGDNTRFCKATQWQPTTTIYQGIEEMLHFLDRN